MSLSASVMQPPPHPNHPSSANAPSLLETTKYDLSFPPFQDICTSFLASLDAFVLNGKEEILARKEEHDKKREEGEGRKRELEAKIGEAGTRESRLLQVLEKEKLELSELSSSISELKTNLSSIESQEKVLAGDLAEWTAKAVKLRAERAARNEALSKHRASITTDLQALEKELCWRVQSFQRDTVLVRYSHLCPRDPKREYSILIDLSTPMYSISAISNPVPSLPILLHRLNQDRDFYGFLKRMRRAFKEVALTE